MGNVVYIERAASTSRHAPGQAVTSASALDLVPSAKVGMETILDEAALEGGRFVLSCRKHAGLTQAELSRLTGINQGAIARLENGKSRRGPTVATLLAVATACGVKLRLCPELPAGANVAGLNRGPAQTKKIRNKAS